MNTEKSCIKNSFTKVKNSILHLTQVYNIMNYMVIQNKIDQIMQEKGISDSQLSEISGLSRMTIFNARRGRKSTLPVIIKISKALGEPFERIWVAKENKEEAA